MFKNLFRKSRCLWDNVEKYDGAIGAINDVTIWRMRIACWVGEATSTSMHTPTRPGTHTYARARARAHTHTQAQTNM